METAVSVFEKHGFPEAERVTGPDLMGELFSRDNGLRHYFYGGKEETIQVLSEKLPGEYPSLRIAGMVSPAVSSIDRRGG